MATPTYTLTLLLKTEIWQKHILNKRLEIGWLIYNTCLGEALKRHSMMKRNKEYWLAINMAKGIERNKILNQFKIDYGISQYSLDVYVKPMGQKFKQNIGSQMAQNIAKRAFKTLEKIMYGDGKKASFSKKGEFSSLEEKTNKTGFRYFPDRQEVEWLGLIMPVIVKKNDEYAQKALNDRIKYCRLVKKVIRGKERFFVQLVLEGIPNHKWDKNPPLDKESRVGIDIGTSTAAIVSCKEAKLVELAEETGINEQQKHKLHRKLDRQRRANNPNKYNDDGTIKQGESSKWKASKNYIKTRQALAEIQRKLAAKRKESHCRLANYVLSLGCDVRVEQMSFKGLQKRAKNITINKATSRINSKKRFGKSLSNRAPAMFLQILDTKLKYEDLTLKKINTAKVKASQFEHFNQTYTKKSLNKRWNHFEQGDIQRDLYSAFLIMNTTDSLDEIDVCEADKTWNNFYENHNAEIKRLMLFGKKQVSCIGV